MFRLWVRAFDDNGKITKNQTFAFKQNFDAKYLFEYMQIVCGEWKTETPMILSSHYAYLANFGHVKFAKSDFVDSVDFEKMIVAVLD